MAFLQFLSGGRDQEFEELHAAHSTYVGSGDEVQIKLGDPGVQPQHCQLYPDPSGNGRFWIKGLGQGSTVIKMRRIGPNSPPDTVQLDPGEVFILGQTYVKFWPEKPPAASAGGGGADPALAAAQQELATAQQELETLRAGAGQAGELEQQLAAAKQEAEAAQSQASEAQQQLEAAQGELQTARGQLETLQGELEAERQAHQTARGELESAQGEASAARQEAESAKADAEHQAEEARADAERQVGEAKADAERQVEEARAALAAEQAEASTALEATRGALLGLEAAAEAREHDRLAAARAPSDLAAALDALQVSDALRARIEQAVTAEVDREVLRRCEGPVVPLRGLTLPGSARDLEAEVRAARRHAQQVAKARELGLAELDPEELDRLLELARS